MQEVTLEVVQSRMNSIEFMRRTGVVAEEVSYGFGRARMPLKGNENHVGGMYIGALSVLAEAGAAICGSTMTDFDRFFPVVRNMNLSFLKPAYSDVTAEYRLSDLEQKELLGALEETGRAEYTASLDLLDEAGVVVATAESTITILTRRD